MTAPKDSLLARLLLTGRETLPIRFALRASRSYTGDDFADLRQADLKSALLNTVNGILERTGRPLLRLDAVRLKLRPCGRDASGVMGTTYYALGLACSQEDADLLREQVEIAWGGALPLNLRRSGPAHAMLYEGDDPADCSYHLDLSSDPFGKLGPEAAHALLHLQGVKVASVTELVTVDGPQQDPNTTPPELRVLHSIGRAPVEGDSIAQIARNWPRPAAVAGDRRMIALVSGGQPFINKTMQAGGWAVIQAEGEDGKPRRERLRLWRMLATVPPRARPSGAADEAPLRQHASAPTAASPQSASPAPSEAGQSSEQPAVHQEAASGQPPSGPEATAPAGQLNAASPPETLASGSPTSPADQPASAGEPDASYTADGITKQQTDKAAASSMADAAPQPASAGEPDASCTADGTTKQQTDKAAASSMADAAPQPASAGEPDTSFTADGTPQHTQAEAPSETLPRKPSYAEVAAAAPMDLDPQSCKRAADNSGETQPSARKGPRREQQRRHADLSGSAPVGHPLPDGPGH